MLKFTLEPQEFTHFYGDTWYTLETFAPIDLELVSSLDELGLSVKERKNVIDIGSSTGQYFLKTSLGLKDDFVNKGQKKVVTLYDVDPKTFGPIQFRELFFSTLHFCKKETWFSDKKTEIVPVSLHRVVTVYGPTEEEKRPVYFNTENCDILAAKRCVLSQNPEFLLRFVNGNEVLYFAQRDSSFGCYAGSRDIYDAIKDFTELTNTNDPQILKPIFGDAVDWIQ
jgi:hypothetical protein